VRAGGLPAGGLPAALATARPDLVHRHAEALLVLLRGQAHLLGHARAPAATDLDHAVGLFPTWTDARQGQAFAQIQRGCPAEAVAAMPLPGPARTATVPQVMARVRILTAAAVKALEKPEVAIWEPRAHAWRQEALDLLEGLLRRPTLPRERERFWGGTVRRAPTLTGLHQETRYRYRDGQLPR
jgi:hypothetical protein